MLRYNFLYFVNLRIKNHSARTGVKPITLSGVRLFRRSFSEDRSALYRRGFFTILYILFSQYINASVELDTNISYSQNKFHATDYYYLGSALTGNGENSLVRAYVYTDISVDPNVNKVGIVKLAPQEAYVNRAKSTESKKTNPIYNADIKYLSLMGRSPVVVLGTKNPSSTEGPSGTDQAVCLGRDTDAGANVTTNKNILKDAGNSDCGGIAGLESSDYNIFAALKPNGSTTFGGVNSGISLLSILDSELSSVNVANLTSAGGTLADYVTMYWDSTISRLYVGLHVSGSNPSYSLLVGRVENNALTLETVLPVAPTSDDYIIGAGSTNFAQIHHVRTMHTSTGKSYVIVNGNVNSADYKKEVFALPIVCQQYLDGTFAVNNASSVGKIAKKTSTSQEEIAVATSDLLIKTDIAAKVGQGGNLADSPLAPYEISDLFVVGDDVFICCTGDDGDKRGIFKSTALFDDNGLTASWTPWQRVMGANDKVIGGNYDDNNANYWYIAEDLSTTNTVIKVTQWGTGDSDLLDLLRTNLASNFSQENAGIHQLFDFSETTSGFKQNEFSMMIATGYQKVALIQTGKYVSSKFVPAAGTDFNDPSSYININTDSALAEIGPICCAEVSRATSGTDGWIFVGGYNGVAVLRNTDGTGWNSFSGSELNTLSTISAFTFKKIGNFRHVHKLVCDGQYLYVMTPQTLYRVSMGTAYFKDSGATALVATTIATAGTSPFGSTDNFLDFIVSSKLGLLATTGGLFRTSNAKNIKTSTSSDWIEVKTAIGSTEYSMGPIVHLHMVSSIKNSFANGGNLYVVAGDMSYDLSTIFRFRVCGTDAVDIDSDTIKPITEHKTYSSESVPAHFYNIGGFRNAFVTDGASGYHSMPKSFGNSEFVRKIKMISRKDLMKAYDVTLSLDTESTHRRCGIPVMNSASGSWVVSGDWVLRFNE